MTKSERREYYIDRYRNSNCTTVTQFYKNPSERKIAIGYNIKDHLYKINGKRYRILGGNGFFFTCAYCYPLGFNSAGKPFWYLRVETPGNTYDYELKESEIEEFGL